MKHSTLSNPFLKGQPLPRDFNAVLKFKVYDLTDQSIYGSVPTTPHKHQYYEIFLIEEGNGSHLIDNVAYPFKKQSIHIVQPGMVHLLTRSADAKGKLVMFATDILTIDHNNVSQNLRRFYDNYLVEPVISPEPEVFAELFSIISLIESSRNRFSNVKDYNTYLQSLFIAFLLSLKPCLASSMPVLIGETDNIYNAFSLLVEDHYDKALSLKDYADRLNITEKTLNRIVKRHTDHTPAQVIRERILLEACRLLHISDLSVKEIAYHLQFSDSAHFIRVFRQKFNCTPLEYRKTA